MSDATMADAGAAPVARPRFTPKQLLAHAAIIGREGHTSDTAGMPLKGQTDLLPVTYVPEPGGVVRRPRGQELTVGREGNALDPAPMSF